jgi:hypothetical protein
MSIGYQVRPDRLRAYAERFAHLARAGQGADESLPDAYERLVWRGLTIWLKRDGGKRPDESVGFLVRHGHPLDRLADDLDWVTAQLKVLVPSRDNSEPRHVEECRGCPRGCPVCRPGRSAPVPEFKAQVSA